MWLQVQSLEPVNEIWTVVGALRDSDAPAWSYALGKWNDPSVFPATFGYCRCRRTQDNDRVSLKPVSLPTFELADFSLAFHDFSHIITSTVRVLPLPPLLQLITNTLMSFCPSRSGGAHNTCLTLLGQGMPSRGGPSFRQRPRCPDLNKPASSRLLATRALFFVQVSEGEL
jgi:hypothetical protein